jgi:hypothetical protein
MGRSYWFECSKCGYRVKVSGRADRGLNFCVQTILCRDCKELYDAVTRMRMADVPGLALGQPAGRLRRPGFLERARNSVPPTFQSALNRLLYFGTWRFKWVQYKAQCPVSPAHRIQIWNEPDKCPRCGILIERTALPYRIWD